MNVNNAEIKTYSPANQFKFNCPIFSAEVEIRQCLVLRDLVWKGKPPAVRKGCQACMSASKCPIVPMVQQMSATNDIYHSAEPKVGRLDNSLLNCIAPIQVPDHILNSSRFVDLTESQITAIKRANDNATPIKLAGPARKRAAAPIAVEALESVTAPATTTTTKPAGMDYAALVNAQIKEESK